jgi:hypothetical protein
MVIDMNETRLRTIEQLKEFLNLIRACHQLSQTTAVNGDLKLTQFFA